jgi:type 2 lantibiotic biosynthesis protein LanM
LLTKSLVNQIIDRSQFIYENDVLFTLPDNYQYIDETIALSESPILRAWRSAFADFSWEDFTNRLLLAKTAPLAPIDHEQFRQNVCELIEYFSVPQGLSRQNWSTSELAEQIQEVVTDYFVSTFFSNAQAIYDDHITDLIVDFKKIFSRWFFPTVRAYCEDLVGSKTTFSSELMIDLLEQYPVFTRLLISKGQAWVSEQLLFFDRLEKDSFSKGNFYHLQSPKKIVSINGSLSDPHHGNQSVRTIEYSNGGKLLYKPKPLQADVVFEDLLSFANRSLDCNLPHPDILVRDGYGWIEFIKRSESNRNDIRQIYDAGVLLGLLHVINATDCHHENIIWTEHSVCLIDCETILQAKPRQVNPLDRHNTLDISFLDSCVRTGFVPSWSMNKRTFQSIDISGLSGFRCTRLRTGIKNHIDKVKNNAQDDSQQLTEADLSPFDFSSNHIKATLDGFSDSLNLFKNNNDAIKDILSRVKPGVDTRYVFRATEVYDAILTYAMQPKHLKNGRQFSICIDLLARAFLKESDKSFVEFVLNEEIKSLLSLDIPKFYSSSDSTVIFGTDSAYENFFVNSGKEYMIEKLHGLSDSVINQEKQILTGLISAASDDKDAPSMRILGETSSLSGIQDRHSSPSYPSTAVDIAKSIIKRQKSPGSYDWWVFGFGPKTGRYQFAPIGMNLYDGRSGVALFLAALGAEGHLEFNLHAHETFKPVLSALNGMDSHELCELAKNIGLGAIAGLGSMIYVSVRLSRYFNDLSYLDAAIAAVSKLDKEVITADQGIDIVSGNAGFILSLIRAYEHSADPMILRQALVASRALVKAIKSKTIQPTQPGVWHPLQVTGFSHGMAGVAYSLLELYRITQQEELHQTALSLIAREQSLRFSDGTYPDLRYDSADLIHSSPNSWCHGLCGIVQSRCLSADLLQRQPSIQNEVENGFKTLKNCVRKNVDHICCGEAGIIDALISGFERTRDQTLLVEAKQRMSRLVDDATKRGHYALNSQIPLDFRSVGFFQGLSGIGYEFLRVQNPSEHQSVGMLV